MNKLPAETSLLCVKGEAKETDNIRPANIKIYISWAILYRNHGKKKGQESRMDKNLLKISADQFLYITVEVRAE